MNKITRCYLSALALSCTQVQAAPILQVQDGILTGAKHVEVAGAYYDVEFLDGTCAALFNGCTDPEDFIFIRQLANQAAQALIDQVLIDTPEGMYDTSPNLTRGCTTVFGICYIITPYGYNLEIDYPHRTSVVNTQNYMSTDRTDNNLIYVNYNYQGAEPVYDFFTFARWTASTPNNTQEPTSIPEPGMLALLSLGLLGSLGVRESMANQSMSKPR